MAKLKQMKQASQSPAELRTRAERAASEGRFQTALDLAKQLNKLAPTPQHAELLNRCYVGRARQLREQGSTRDAAAMLETAFGQMNGDPARIIKIAEELALAGEFNKAMLVFGRLPDPKPPNRIPQLAADFALQRGANGRAALPESMHADFDRLRQAFAHLEASRDDPAREAIQGIGLTSPFLEWKLLLRGLLAFYQNDDARAVENWSRLDPLRFPARLAAPWRAPIDSGFRSAQTPEAQQVIGRLSEQLLGNPILAGLRNVRRLMHSGQGLTPALREVQPLLLTFKQQRPDLLNRLADCFYWEIVDHGYPDDVLRFKHLFGKPPDDPDFHRMTAMAMERESGYREANEIWQEYEKQIAGHPQLTQPERDRVGAMLWMRMGANARKQEDVVHATKNLPFMPIDLLEKPKLLKPGAEACLRKSVELAPDWLEPHFALLQEFLDHFKSAPAIETGRKLLERFPDHLPTLEALADLYRKQNKLDEAAKLLEQAHHANPLIRELRSRLGQTRRMLGGRLAMDGKLDRARTAFQSALHFTNGVGQFMTLGAWAACEFKAGDAAKAEELLNQAAGIESYRDARDAYLLALATEWKLPKPVKSRFETAFKQQLASEPTPAGAIALATLFAEFQRDGFEYHGSKTHLKKVLALVAKLKHLRLTEPQVIQLGTSLLELNSAKLLRELASSWELDYPDSPYPPYFEIEARLAKKDVRAQWRVKPLVERARKLVDRMPPGDIRDMLSKRLESIAEQLQGLSPFASVLERLMDRFGDGPFDDYFEEDDEPW